MPDIKKIQIGGIEYDIDALKLNGHTWAEIEAMVGTGFTIETPWLKSDYESTSAPSTAKKATVPAITIYYNNGQSSTTGTLSAADNESKKHLYLIYHSHEDGNDNYDEYVSTGSGVNARWEKIGNTDIDLSNYQQIGKTLTTTAPSTNSTSSAGGQTVTTTAAGEQTALGSATITYDKADNATGSAGAGESANTGEAGGTTIDGSSFGFSGKTATITVAGAVSGTGVADHEAQTITVTGSQTVAAHSHTVNCAKDTVTAITEINGGSYTGATQASYTQGAKATLSYTARANVMCSPTVSTLGVLSWGTVDCDDITAWTANGTDTFTPNNVGTFTPASVKTSKTCTYVTGATTSAISSYTISGENFSVEIPTLTHSVTQGTVSIAVTYRPEGSITGSATIASHSHSYTKPTAHTHSIGSTTTTVTGSVEVAISDHTHSVTVASHTHDLGNHTHNVTTTNN